MMPSQLSGGQDDTQDTGDKLDNVTDRDTDITAVDDGGALETEEATQQSFVPQTVFESGSQAVMTWSQLGYALQVFAVTMLSRQNSW